MKIIVPPSALPVSAAALAAQLHIDEAEVPQLEALLYAAVAVVETATNRPIMQRTVEIDLPEGAWSEFWLPCAPCHELVDADGIELISGFDEPRIRRDGFEGSSVRAVVGYAGVDEAPQQLIAAIRLLAMEWREAHISLGDQYTAPSVSFGAQRLIKQVRYRRPMVSR